MDGYGRWLPSDDGLFGVNGVAECVEYDACEDADADEECGDGLQKQCYGIDNSVFCVKLCCVGCRVHGIYLRLELVS